MDVNRRIELFLKTSGMTPTRFGRDCVHDPRLVFDMRNGRALGTRIQRRIDSYLAEHGA
ncbi:hypothetical protein GGR88_001799 [Sphingomonas jejuensis]|uniref:Uncharacterized protein n=1 Tax=Sphingomonas jejuensis TaxID=904715 RepID=A0ABX0XNQ9_9SPHN|nr:hypothetical protein [Sphingomonas jejuensis]NJC34325.1 hypothetical protein [Sphingomonas jejuensis]